MNWNGGALSRSRHKTTLSLSAAQKRYSAKAQAQSQTTQQFTADLEFSALEQARREELDSRKRSPPSPRIDHHEGSSKPCEASLKKGRAVIPQSSSSSPASQISRNYKKDDSLEDQKQKLLAMNDWCGLKKPPPVEMVSTSTENVNFNGDGRKGYNKRQLSDSSEAYSPLEGLAGIKYRRKSPRNLHKAEEKRHRANKRKKSEFGRRIGPLDGRSGDGSEFESSSLHRDSPFCRALERVVHNAEEKRHRANKRHQSEFGRRIGPLDGRSEDGSEFKSSLRDSPFCRALEAYYPLEGLAGIKDRRKSPRNLHNAEEKRYRANKRQQSEIGRRIGPLDGRSEDGSEFKSPATVRSNHCWEGGIATEELGEVACSMILMEGTIGNLTSTTVQSPRTIKGGDSLSSDFGWKDFVIGGANGEISDSSPSNQRFVNSQTDPQYLDSWRDKEGSSLLSSPHQFAFLYSEPSDEPSFDQQNPHENQGICSPLSNPHRFSPISSDKSTSPQSTAHATCSLSDISRESPFYSPEHPPVLRDQLASPNDRESTEELEQRAESHVKPAFVFTKPARFVGERVVGVSSSTETGEYQSRNTDSSLGQAPPEWRPEEEEVEDIED